MLWQLNHVTLAPRRLCGITVTILPGITAILGHSGAGKTSLLNLLVNFEQPDHGTCRSTIERGSHTLPAFWVPQDAGLWPHLTARQHLEAVSKQMPDELLAAFDLSNRADCRPATLSQGECARLAVARALAADAAVLVMDEPLAHVDPARVGKYWDVIRAHLVGRALVFSTHAPVNVLAHAQRAICLKEGRALFDGTVEELYWRPPSQGIAECAGEVNWLAPEEMKLWLQRDESVDRAYRPEQIALTTTADGPFVVESSRFGGAIAEVELREPVSGATRRFFHRPSANHLARGTRVLLKVLLLMLLIGCGNKAATIAVKEIHVWPVPPGGTLQPAPRSVGTGNSNEVVVLDTAGRVLVYDETGKLRRHWFMPDTKIGKPEGVVVLNDGRVVVCDTHYHQVVIFDSTGKVVQIFGSEGQAAGQFIYPFAVAKDAQENLYVCEYGSNDRVQKFTRDGKFILAFGSFGTGPGQFQRPSGIVWNAGKVYIADAFNNRIQEFTDDGKYVRTLGPATLNFPYDLRLGTDGAFYVIEYGAARLTKLDRDGNLLGRFGGPGSGVGQFATPWGMAIDAQSRVRIADTGNRRLVELRL